MEPGIQALLNAVSALLANANVFVHPLTLIHETGRCLIYHPSLTPWHLLLSGTHHLTILYLDTLSDKGCCSLTQAEQSKNIGKLILMKVWLISIGICSDSCTERCKVELQSPTSKCHILASNFLFSKEKVTKKVPKPKKQRIATIWFHIFWDFQTYSDGLLQTVAHIPLHSLASVAQDVFHLIYIHT